MTLIRTEPFVPLISNAPASCGDHSDFQATVLSQPDQAHKFHAVEPSAAASAGPAGGPRGSNCEPHVSVQRDGDQVSGIRIQCSCGQVIDLACVYQSAPGAPQA